MGADLKVSIINRSENSGVDPASEVAMLSVCTVLNHGDSYVKTIMNSHFTNVIIYYKAEAF